MNNWKNNESFMQMEPDKQHMVELLVNSLHGKNLSEALPILSNWKDKLRSENITFTASEDKLLTDIFIEMLPPKQKSQYEFFFFAPISLIIQIIMLSSKGILTLALNHTAINISLYSLKLNSFTARA